MKSNQDLQKDVRDAIDWEPLLRDSRIDVTATDGVVTLTGMVDSYIKKTEADDVVKSIPGVKAVVDAIEIRFDNMTKKEDREIAMEISDAFIWNWEVPENRIDLKVKAGWVRLEGDLEWNYQKDAAQKTAGNITGVRGITNVITIRSQANDATEKKEIEKALAKDSDFNDHTISVKVSGNDVTLKGTVDSFSQRDQAERIALKVPGVWSVKNDLFIG